MNYDHVNKTQDYWMMEIFPHLSHKMMVASFDEYLKRFSFLKSGRWLKDMDSVKILKPAIALDPLSFVTKYKTHCVTYNPTARPEDGLQRIIYQVSPTLHAETGLWAWVENNNLQSYMSIIVCYHTEKEFTEFLKEITPMRRVGNTQEQKHAGFAGFAGLAADSYLTKGDPMGG